MIACLLACLHKGIQPVSLHKVASISHTSKAVSVVALDMVDN